MIITGATTAVPFITALIVFTRSGPGVDPRIRVGAAVVMLLSVLAGGIGAGLVACLGAAADLREEIQAVRRECDHVGLRRELRESVALNRRLIAREIRERHRQIADWLPVVEPMPGQDDGTGPHHIVPR